MIYIRVDANEKIATGHMMRCITIAKALRQLGENTTFITADRYGEEILRENGFEMICLESKWDNLESELPQLLQLISQQNTNILLIDSYYVTPKYLNALHKKIKIAYIDDINKFIYSVDMLVNYAIYHKKFKYQERYQNKKIKLCLGGEYVPLRKEFEEQKRKTKEQVADIFITTGGTDPYHIQRLLLERVLEEEKFNKIRWHFVVGRFSEDKELLKESASKYENIKIYENLNHMAELMAQCDLAISAGGTTLFELCACGLPTICFSFADNQLEGIRAFEEQNVMKSIGDMRSNTKQKVEELIFSVIKLYDNKEKRSIYTRNMQVLVDAKGADRIAKQLMQLNNRNIEIMPRKN